MAIFRGNLHNGNGYKSGSVEVNMVITQAAATRALEARYPGATITALRFISNKDCKTVDKLAQRWFPKGAQ